ncbi:MAG: DUF2807 domain-containing protein [Bacteroidales bacterium]|nr:DUF2807 domain-containing protein [Bacteroidales bacterium]
MKKVLIAIFGILAMAVAANAQTITKSQEYSAFNTIEIGDSFNVTFRPSATGAYSAEWTVDSMIEDFIEIYVKNKTLYVNLNEKDMNKNKEIKAYYKGKNAPKPVLNVVIKVPTFQKMVLSENAVVDAMGTNFENNDFTLEVAGSAKVNNLTVNAQKGKIVLEKNANVNMNINANDLEVEMENNAVLNLNQETKNLSIKAEDSANITLIGGSNVVTVNLKNAPKLNLSGSATTIDMTCQDRAETDASRFPVKDVTLKMKGNSKFTANVSANLSLEMDGATFTFSGNPAIKIVSLNKATVLTQQ